MNYVIIRLFFVMLVIFKGWLDAHLDVKCAYLYGDLNELTYMERPPGFRDGKDRVWKLKKAIYCLHESGRIWYDELCKQLENLGLSQLIGYNCVFILKSSCIVLFYVDDIVIFAKNISTKNRVIGLLQTKFDMVDLGPVTSLLGVLFERTRGDIFLYQSGFFERLARKFDNGDKRF